MLSIFIVFLSKLFEILLFCYTFDPYPVQVCFCYICFHHSVFMRLSEKKCLKFAAHRHGKKKVASHHSHLCNYYIYYFITYLFLF